MNAELTGQELRARAEELREALYRQAQQLRSYFSSSLRRIEACPVENRASHALDFLSRAGLLVTQLDTLVRSARHTPELGRTLNLEQLEATVALLYGQIRGLSASLVPDNAQSDPIHN